MNGPRTAPSWRPGASRHAIESRARLLAAIRTFMAAREVLEVESPILSRCGAIFHAMSDEVDQLKCPQFLLN